MNVLFASTYSLLDTTSGAAISIRSLLEGLFKYGFVSEAVTASIFDPPWEISLESVARAQSLELSHQQDIATVSTGLLKHTILKTSSSKRFKITEWEEEKLIFEVGEKLRAFQPDILLTYGGLPGEKKIHRLARRLGVPVVFFLSNCLYRKPDTFADVDLILVPSKFLREFYRERLGIGSRVLYPVISKARCLFNPACQSSNLEKEKFVTLVNPHPQKGLAVFIRLAAECMQLFPNLKFLLVEGRWNLKELANQPLLSGLPNVRLMENSLDMRQVYASTKILLFPSFWLDAFGQTVVEAHLNGIPVLASDRGGIPEALNGAGFLLDVPDGIPKELKSAKAIFEIASQRARGPIPIPTAEEIRPWIATIRLLLESRDAYEEASKRAYIAAEPFHSESTLQMAADLFRGYRPTVSHRA